MCLTSAETDHNSLAHPLRRTRDNHFLPWSIRKQKTRKAPLTRKLGRRSRVTNTCYAITLPSHNNNEMTQKACTKLTRT